MGKHFTKNTVSAAKWCNQCKAFTQHKCAGHKLTYCIPCFERQQKEHKEKPAEPPVLQRELKF
jgi:hypothetical protein